MPATGILSAPPGFVMEALATPGEVERLKVVAPDVNAN
jgi:hypothetical protein